MLGDKETISTNIYQEHNLSLALTQAMSHRNDPDTISPQGTLNSEKKCQHNEKYVQGQYLR